MGFVKNGDAEKIVLIGDDEAIDDSQTKLALEKLTKSIQQGKTELEEKNLENN